MTLPPDQSHESDDITPLTDEQAEAEATNDASSVALSADGDLDVESALAAVATLQDLIAINEAAEQAQQEQAETFIEELEDEPLEFTEPAYQSAMIEDDEPLILDHDDDMDELPEVGILVREQPRDTRITGESDALDQLFEQSPVARTNLAQPPISELNRGTPASVIPAILLIALGGLLTLLLSSQQLTLTMTQLGWGTLASIGVILLSFWIATGRWAAGSFFFGMIAVLSAAIGYYLSLADTMTYSEGLPLFIIALGATFILTDILTRLRQNVWFAGLIIGATGVIWLLISGDALTFNPFTRWTWLLPLIGVLLLITLIAPVFAGRRAHPVDE